MDPKWFRKIFHKREYVETIPNQFEFIDTLTIFRDMPKVPVYVTILDKFVHHYSNEMMYYIRLETVGCFGSGMVDYKTIKESELLDMLKTRKV